MSAENEIARLLLQVKEGDEGAFAKLSALFEPLVLTSVRRFCTPPAFGEADFEDLRQEALLALFKAARSYDPKKAAAEQKEGEPPSCAEQSGVTFGLYAKICINNRLISAKRSRLRKLQCADPAAPPKRGVGRPRKNAPAPKKSGRALNLPTDSQLLDLLEAAKEDLSPIEEQVFALYLQGSPYKEIAALCGVDLKAVDNALSRAKRKIKRRAGRA